MPALKPATIGQKFLTDCGQNRPLTTRCVSIYKRKGSIFVRTKGSGQYCYLNYRDGSRVVSEYISSPDSPKVQDIKEQIEERKRVKQIIKDMKLEQKEIERALK